MLKEKEKDQNPLGGNAPVAKVGDNKDLLNLAKVAREASAEFAKEQEQPKGKGHWEECCDIRVWIPDR